MDSRARPAARAPAARGSERGRGGRDSRHDAPRAQPARGDAGRGAPSRPDQGRPAPRADVALAATPTSTVPTALLAGVPSASSTNGNGVATNGAGSHGGSAAEASALPVPRELAASAIDGPRDAEPTAPIAVATRDGWAKPEDFAATPGADAPVPPAPSGPTFERVERPLRGGRPGPRTARPGPELTPTPERAELPHHLIDRDALDVVRRLRRAGHVAYLVGGCVRDLSLGFTPKDFDVATSARPEEIRAVFRNCRIIGRRFRLAHVFFRGGKVIETSTFRANVTAPESEEDADLLIRHDNVFGSEEEDALRRDFTINGLFYDPNSGRIIDHVGGLDDLRLRRVRMIGNPDIRLREDPVRILRAVRIAAKTNLSIDPELLAAMERHRGELPRCSPARLFEERMRLFRSGSGEKGLRLLEQTAVLAAVLPLVASYLALARATGRHEDAELLFGHIAALDALARRGEVSDVLIIAALLHAPVAQHVAAQQAPDLHAALIDELVLQATELGATRKMTERLRQVLLAQRHLERPSGRRKTRRVPPEALMRRVYFAEALDFFEIVGRATQREEHLDELAMWRDRPAVEADGGDDEGEEPSPHAGATPTSGRRRRRRRGGRGEGRSGADATPAS